MAHMTRPVHLIAGPTASGKSAYALDIAKQTGGAVINADSMQIYDVLRIITARPPDEDLSQAPHHLYGHINPATLYSTGVWMREVEALLATLPSQQPLVFVGGTGLYFKALTGGLSPIPAIPDMVRERWRYRLNEQGAPALHRQLRSADPQVAMALKANDGQRIARALEVLEATGKSIAWWQTQTGKALIDVSNAQKTILLPDRKILHERINKRFSTMADNGALDEVRALNKLDLPTDMPARKAIGVPELSQFLAGNMAMETAIERAQAATRQYAKRQMTWLRNQLDDSWQKIFP